MGLFWEFNEKSAWAENKQTKESVIVTSVSYRESRKAVGTYSEWEEKRRIQIASL